MRAEPTGASATCSATEPPPTCNFEGVASVWLMYEGRGWNGPPSAEDLEQIRRQRARSGGGGPPFGGAHWNLGPAFGAVARAHPSAVQGANKPKLGAGLSSSFEPSSASLEWVRERARSGGGPPIGGAHRNPGPAFGAVARAHPAAVQGANRPKLGAGLSPSFEPSSASLEWVRERVGGGSARAWKLGAPCHLGSALSRPMSRCGPAGRSLGIGAASGRGTFNQPGENKGPGQPHGARGLDRWCPNLSAPPACAPRARRTYDGAGARQAHARHPSPIAEDPPPSWRGAPWWIVRAYARLG